MTIAETTSLKNPISVFKIIKCIEKKKNNRIQCKYLIPSKTQHDYETYWLQNVLNFSKILKWYATLF